MAIIINRWFKTMEKETHLLPVWSAAAGWSAGFSSALAPDELAGAAAPPSLLGPQPIFYLWDLTNVSLKDLTDYHYL